MDGSSVREEALDWFEEALVDLQRARRLLQLGDYSLSCYLSQQAVEKSFKAALIGLRRRRPPHIHDLTALYSELRGTLHLPREIEERLAEVSQYYVTARYPNAGLTRPSKSFTRSQAERALEVAELVIERIREALTTHEN